MSDTEEIKKQPVEVYTKTGEKILFSRYFITEDFKILSKSREMKIKTYSKGYLGVELYADNNKVYGVLIHRVIATMFIPGYVTGFEVNHINGLKTDNTIKNLEWISHKDNVIHGVQFRVSRAGDKNHNCTISNETAISIYNSKDSTNNISESLNVSKSLVMAIRSGRRWSKITNHIK